MDKSSDIAGFIRSVRERARFKNVLEAFLAALIAGSLAAAAFLAYTRLFVFTGDITITTLYYAIPLSLLVMAGVMFRFRFSLNRAAFEADQALGLKSRLISAFEAQSKQQSGSSLTNTLFNDAQSSIEGKKPRDVMTIDLKTHLLAGLAALLVPIAVAQLPMVHADEVERIKSEKVLVAETGKKLVHDAKKLGQKAKVRELPKTAKSLEELSGIGKMLAEKKLNQTEAIKALTKFEDKINKARSTQTNQALRKTLEAAKKSLGQISKSGDKGQNKPGSPSEALKDIAGLLAGGVVSPEEKQRIIEKLENAAKGLSKEGKEGEIKESLEAAIKALKEGSNQQGGQGGGKPMDPEALAEALKMIEQGAQMFKDMENEMNDAEKLAEAQALAQAAKQKLLKKKQCKGGALGQGQTQMFSDYGTGTSNEADPGFTAEAMPTYSREDKNSKSMRTELYDERYEEERLGKQGYDSKLKGDRNPKGDANFGYVRARPGGKVESAMDLVDELPAYGQAAEDALEKQRIPNEYKDFVKDYFTELDEEFNK